VYGKIDVFIAELEAIAAAADKREIERRKEEQAARDGEVCICAPGWRTFVRFLSRFLSIHGVLLANDHRNLQQAAEPSGTDADEGAEPIAEDAAPEAANEEQERDAPPTDAEEARGLDDKLLKDVVTLTKKLKALTHVVPDPATLQVVAVEV
jgi:hypothetical protein